MIVAPHHDHGSLLVDIEAIHTIMRGGWTTPGGGNCLNQEILLSRCSAPRYLIPDHGIEADEQLSHRRCHCDFLRLSSSYQALIEGLDDRVVVSRGLGVERLHGEKG